MDNTKEILTLAVEIGDAESIRSKRHPEHDRTYFKSI